MMTVRPVFMAHAIAPIGVVNPRTGEMILPEWRYSFAFFGVVAWYRIIGILSWRSPACLAVEAGASPALGRRVTTARQTQTTKIAQTTIVTIALLGGPRRGEPCLLILQKLLLQFRHITFKQMVSEISKFRQFVIHAVALVDILRKNQRTTFAHLI